MDFHDLELVILKEAENRGEQCFKVRVAFPESLAFVSRAASVVLAKLESAANVLTTVPPPENHPESVRNLTVFCLSSLGAAEFSKKVKTAIGADCECSPIGFGDLASVRERIELELEGADTEFTRSRVSKREKSVIQTLFFDYKAILFDFVSLLDSVSKGDRRMKLTPKFEKALMDISRESSVLVEFQLNGEAWALPDCVVRRYFDLDQDKFWRSSGYWLYETQAGPVPIYGLGSEPDWKRILPDSRTAAGILVEYGDKRTILIAEVLEGRIKIELGDFRYIERRDFSTYVVGYGQSRRLFILPSTL
jgi:hypothetical protein